MLRHALAALGVIAALLALRPVGTSGTELLANGGFESGPGPWGNTDGALDTVGAPVYQGASAGRLTGTYLQMHEVYQFLDVRAGAIYSFSGWVYLDDQAAARAFLKVRWLSSSGVEINNEQSASLTIHKPAFQAITTGNLTAPPGAVRARFGILVEPNAPFTVYLDNFSLDGPAYVPGPTPSPTPAPTPQPTAPASATPGASPAPAPTAAPTSTPDAGPVEEPQFFPVLTNGGFEDLGSEGMPYGWRKVGGQMSAVDQPRMEGGRALRLASATTSTKWVYQTVLVEPGAYYEASVSGVKNDPAVESLLLRLSWYASETGDGAAIASVDSLDSLATDAQAFRPLTTGPVLAPVDARSVRLKLMLRPVSAVPAAGYFDDVRLGRVARPAVLPGSHGSNAATGSVRRGGASAAAAPGVLGALSTPVVPANVRARPTPVNLATAAPGGDGKWLKYTSMAVAASSLGIAGFGLWRRRVERSRQD